jgi:hypothetical protein
MIPATFTLDFFAGPAGDLPFRAIVTLRATGKTGVAFHDRRNTQHDCNGQLISRYHITDLLNGGPTGGLDMDGGVDNWTIPGDVWPFVFEWLGRVAHWRKARRVTGGAS